MKDFFILKMLDRMQWLFTKAGIDYKVMRKILQLKLTMDERRVPTIMSNKKDIEKKNSFVLSLLLYTFIGLIISVFVWMPVPLYFKYNVIFGMIMFMVLATMISDFSSVLLDVRDKNILLSKPIDNKTLNMAKVIHIVSYLIKISFALAGPTLIMSLFKYGPLFFGIMLIEIIFICGLIMFITSALYFVILSIFDGEKLKDIINYFQIILVICMTIGYQFIGRIFEVSRLDIIFAPKWWNYLIPTTWFASPLCMLVEHTYDTFYVISSLCALAIPAISVIVYLKFIVPYFERNLQKLTNSGGRKKLKDWKVFVSRKISSLACADKSERAFYIFTKNMISSERKLKLQLFPNLAFATIMPFIFIFMYNRGPNQSFSEIFYTASQGNGYISIYFSIIFLSMSISFLGLSEKYMGAWIYKTLPIESPGFILKAAFKGFMLKYNIPIFTLICVFAIFVFGIRIIPDVFLMLFNMVLVSLVLFKLSPKQLPFYKDFQLTQNTKNMSTAFILLLLTGAVAGIHFVAISIPFGVLVDLTITAGVTILFWKICFNVSWKDIEES